MFGLSSEFPLNYSAAGEKIFRRVKSGYVTTAIEMLQKRSGPDFPNVNYGVKFLKFDSEQFLDFQKDFKEKKSKKFRL